MKKLMKVCMIMMLFICSGCSNQDNDIDYDKDVSFKTGLSYALSSKGMYFYDHDDNGENVVYFYDRASKKVVPLCQKVNCNHKDKTCYAYQLGSIQENNQCYQLISMIYQQNRLYLAYYPLSLDPILIKSIAEDGSDLKIEYELKDIGLLNGFSMRDKQIIISRNYMEKNEAGKIIGSSTINSLVFYDMQSQKEKILVNEEKKKDKFIYQLGMIDDDLYYFDIGFSEENKLGNLYSINLINNETKNLGSFPSLIQMYKENIYYVKNNQIICYNLRKQKEHKISDFPHERANISVSHYGTLDITYQDDTLKNYVQIIDLKTEKNIFDEEMINIEILGKYNDSLLYKDEKNQYILYNIKDKKSEKIDV